MATKQSGRYNLGLSNVSSRRFMEANQYGVDVQDKFRPCCRFSNIYEKRYFLLFTFNHTSMDGVSHQTWKYFINCTFKYPKVRQQYTHNVWSSSLVSSSKHWQCSQSVFQKNELLCTCSRKLWNWYKVRDYEGCFQKCTFKVFYLKEEVTLHLESSGLPSSTWVTQWGDKTPRAGILPA